jgi:hypothetical protein
MKRSCTTKGRLAAAALVVAGSLTLSARPADACSWSDADTVDVFYCQHLDSRAGAGAQSGSDVATTILNRTVEAQRTLQEGIRQLQDILQARSAPGSAPRVSNLRDKTLPPQQVGADLSPSGYYYYPIKVDPFNLFDIDKTARKHLR